MSSEYNPLYAHNNGQVKINDGNGIVAGWGFGDPSINGQWQSVIYNLPLGLSSSPTTTWPETILNPTDDDIYDNANERFIENPVLGQSHLWRIQFEYLKAQGPNTEFFFEIRNNLSGFILADYFLVQREGIPYFDLVTTLTIADSASVPAPNGTGEGYELRVMASNDLLQENPENYMRLVITRISTHYSVRG